jgi:putative endonuclease
VARRWKSPFAEIDLVLRSSENLIYLVEVKKVSSFEFLSHRLSARQIKRLKRAHMACCEQWGEVVLQLAVVSQQAEVLIIENVFG